MVSMGRCEELGDEVADEQQGGAGEHRGRHDDAVVGRGEEHAGQCAARPVRMNPTGPQKAVTVPASRTAERKISVRVRCMLSPIVRA